MRPTAFIAISLLLPAGLFAGNLESGMERFFANDFLAPEGPLRNAAAPGDPHAQAIRDAARLHGQAITPASGQAGALTTSAALRGDAQAQLALAIRYENGNGVPKDGAAAMVWYERAAAQGLPEAQRILGILYLTGAHGPANEATGMAWLRQAAEQGDAFGKTLRDFYDQKSEASAIAALRTCHQSSVTALEDGNAAADVVTAAIQASCVAEMDAWIHAHFPQAASYALVNLRKGARAAEQADVAASVAALRTARQSTPTAPAGPAQASR
jgi:TPR repeat protein